MKLKTTALYLVFYNQLDKKGIIEEDQILVKKDIHMELFETIVGDYLEKLVQDHEKELKDKQDIIDRHLREKGDIK